MSGSFADSAVRLAPLAARSLGWRPAEFWNATPSELALCLAADAAEALPPSRQQIATLIERDRDNG